MVKKTWRVFNSRHTPLEGSEDYLDVETEQEAQHIVWIMNHINPERKCWAYSD